MAETRSDLRVRPLRPERAGAAAEPPPPVDPRLAAPADLTPEALGDSLGDSLTQVVDNTLFRVDVPASLLRLLDGPVQWVAAYAYMRDPWDVTVEALPAGARRALSEVVAEDGGPTEEAFGLLLALMIAVAARTQAPSMSYTVHDVLGLCAAARQDLGLGAIFWQDLGRLPALDVGEPDGQGQRSLRPCARCTGALGHWLHLWAKRQLRQRLVAASPVLPDETDAPRPSAFGTARRRTFLN